MANKTLIKIGKILGILAGIFMIIGGVQGIIGDDFLFSGNNYLQYSPVGSSLETLNRLVLGILMIVIGALFIVVSVANSKKMNDMTIGIVLLILSIVFSNLLGLLGSILIIIGELVS